MTAIAQAQDDDAELVEELRTGKRKCPSLKPTLSERPLLLREWREIGADAADRLERIAARLSVTTPDTTVLVEARRCTICHAIVASYPEGMCCHCRELPWPLASTANPTGETSNG